MKSDNAIWNGTGIFVGIIVAIAAFVRGALLLPLLLGLNGIWMGVVVAELLTLIVTVYFLRSRKKVYHY